MPGVPSQPPLRAHGRAKMAGQRGIYLTFGDACVIISSCKAILRHQMCPKRLPEEHKTSVPLVRRRHLWRVGPSTRGATAPQGAQQVNFVIGCSCPVAHCGAAMACIQMRHLRCHNAKWELCCSVCYTPWLRGAAHGKTSSRHNLRGALAWSRSTTTAPPRAR